MYVVQVANEFVKSLFARHSARTFIPQPPFADHLGMVSGLFQNLRHRQFLRSQCLIFGIPPNAVVSAMHARHQRRPRRRADSAAGITTHEANPFGRQLVQVRGFDFRLAVTTQIAIAKVVGQNENNIWTPRRRWPISDGLPLPRPNRSSEYEPKK